MKKNDDFELVNKNLPEECNDPEIKEEDFVLTEVDGSIHEQKFQTKPTTFLKDSMRRFAKNKSSVVAAYILGFLILLSIIVPLASPYDVSGASDTAFYNLEPKLFNSGTGFWDGTVKKYHVPVDTSYSEDPNDWYPDPTTYKKSGIKNKSIDGSEFTNVADPYGRKGYVEFGYYGMYGLNEASMETFNSNVDGIGADNAFVLDLDETQLTLTQFETVNEDKISEYYYMDYDPTRDPKLPDNLIPENFVLADTILELDCEYEGEAYRIPLTEKKKIHNTGSELDVGEKETIDINKAIKDYFNDLLMTPPTELSLFHLAVTVYPDEGKESDNYCTLIRSLVIEPTSKTGEAIDQKIINYFSGRNVSLTTFAPGISFDNATEFNIRTTKVQFGQDEVKNLGYWSVPDYNKYTKNVFMSMCTYASFTYDGYEGSLGERNMMLTKNELETYRDKGYLDFDIGIDYDISGQPYVSYVYCSSKDEWSSKCPLVHEFTEDDVYITGTTITGDIIYVVNTDLLYYKYLGYDAIPSFLFGTDKTGKDMFKYVFEGLRNSLLLGLFTFIICFLFGLAWGAISGYFGGAVDLVMERITDILAGLPWIVVMTIVILKTSESNFWTFALALCLTGWIGTASLTRTQFYRFRGREYVLASRTLGASHGRLIAKHILPNAMGTIITSSVLMIPAIIFEEATISYLGLGFKNLSSLGVILSNNQNELTNHPYQLIFPSVIIALVMISFNLFGNGLRDAINPSLKGEDE